MPYQYKREPLSDDEVNRLSDACEELEERFVILALLDHLRASF
jgi:integrase/recombinase XerD